MLLKELINNNEYVFVYEFNDCLTSTDMYGAILFKGNSNAIHEKTLNRKVIRMFNYVHPVFIVE